MPIEGEEKTEYQRRYMRTRRSGTGPKVKLAPDLRRRSAEDVCGLLERMLELLEKSEMDLAVRSRCIFQGAGVLLRALEVAGLEKRLRKLEAALAEGQQNEPKLRLAK